jgi:hypothetical protein
MSKELDDTREALALLVRMVNAGKESGIKHALAKAAESIVQSLARLERSQADLEARLLKFQKRQ